MPALNQPRANVAADYATRRVNEHILRFTRLYDELTAGRLTEPWLADLEKRDNVFPHLDYRVYAS